MYNVYPDYFRLLSRGKKSNRLYTRILVSVQNKFKVPWYRICICHIKTLQSEKNFYVKYTYYL